MSQTSSEGSPDDQYRETLDGLFKAEDWDIIRTGFERMDEIDPDDNVALRDNLHKVLGDLGLSTENPPNIRGLGKMAKDALENPDKDRPPLKFGLDYGVAPHGLGQQEWDELDPYTKMTLLEKRTDDPI
jgi:hypothetical protein